MKIQNTKWKYKEWIYSVVEIQCEKMKNINV